MTNEELLKKLREMQAENDKARASAHTPCPSCGHCPTCGRSGYRLTPWYPYTSPYPYTYPWYGTTSGGTQYTLTSTATNGLNFIGYAADGPKGSAS